MTADFLARHRRGSHASLQTSLRLPLKEQVLRKAEGAHRDADPVPWERVASRLP